MAKKPSGKQQEVVGRVMHAFKHGELASAGGRQVRNPRQAIAIALHEAGRSDQQTPAQNRRGAAERDPTRAELYAEARRAGIPGRSRMRKAELQRALQAARH